MSKHPHIEDRLCVISHVEDSCGEIFQLEKLEKEFHVSGVDRIRMDNVRGFPLNLLMERLFHSQTFGGFLTAGEIIFSLRYKNTTPADFLKNKI